MAIPIWCWVETNSAFLPQFGRLDGSFGHVLLGDGKGGFTWIDPRRSGLLLPGQIRGYRRDHR